MAKTAFANRTNAYTFDPDELVLVADPSDPLYDERIHKPLDEGLVLSIMCGWFGAIEIAKRGDVACVVDGRQRVRAAQEANRRLRETGREPVRVSAILQRGDDADLFGVTIAANSHRSDDSPVARAKKIARFLSMGRSEAEAAVRFGLTVQALGKQLQLLELAPQVQKAVEQGRTTATAATKLAKLPRAEQVEALAQLTAEAPQGKRVSVKTVAAKAKASTPSTTRRGIKEVKARLAGAVQALENDPLDAEARARVEGWIRALRWDLGAAEGD